MCAVQVAKPLDRDELCDHLLVVELVQVVELELAGEDVLGERSQVAHLRARQPGRRAQLLGVLREDLLRRGGRPSKRSVRRA